MTVPRTDLALEAADDLAARAKKFSLPEGIQRLESLQEGYPVTDIRVTGEGARTLGKPAGRYITVDLTPCFQRQQAFFHRAVWCIAYQLRALLPHVGRRSQVLVVGLGNRAMTPDAIGPIAVENLLVTRHMVRALPRQFQGFTPVSALCTGVLARTGLETLELIQGAAAHIRPAAVIAIDALAARSRQRLCTCQYQFLRSSIDEMEEEARCDVIDAENEVRRLQRENQALRQQIDALTAQLQALQT